MNKQEYKFTLGNGSEQDIKAVSLSAMLANLPLAEKLKLQKRIVEERGRSKKVVEQSVEPPITPTQTLPETTDPKAELKAKFMEVLQKLEQDQIIVTQLREKLAKLKDEYYIIK